MRLFRQVEFLSAVILPVLSAQPFTFEVASVKLSLPDQSVSGITTERGIFKADNVLLRNLVSYALGVQRDQVSGGPNWAEDVRFDIIAKNERTEEQDIPETDRKNLAARDARIRSRLRNLLDERFQLKFREELKETQVYVLTAEKSGLKVKVATEPKGNFSTSRSNLGGTLHGDGVTLQRLAAGLSAIVQRPVLNETGLDGVYDLDLRYSADDSGQPTEDQNAPGIFTAIREQLGLRLTGRQATVKHWVIEKAEKPGEN